MNNRAVKIIAVSAALVIGAAAAAVFMLKSFDRGTETADGTVGTEDDKVTATDTETTDTGYSGAAHVSTGGDDVTGDGSESSPFATVDRAARVCPGSLIIVHGGTYGAVSLDASCSGSEEKPTVIRAAEGESVRIVPEGGTGIYMVNVSYITIDGFEVLGGTHGIEYESTSEAGAAALCDVTLRNCEVHGIRGVHGICVYARNDLAPVSNLTIEGCQVYDCQCGSSESLVINGNVDGFLICGNIIHDNNNIGIDMIGFEGTAKHRSKSDANPYEVDYVRNGVCRDNIVYNISAEGNLAYYDNGEYDLCADGIYVDGGSNIEIYRNFIFNCDIGLEVATEHSPDDNGMFRVSGVNVHDNVIADCTGWAGLCFGGYDRDLGFTEKCEFHHNTLVDNGAQIAVQRSRNNRVYANLILGGEAGVEFNDSCRPEDLINDIFGNAAAGIRDEDSWEDAYGKLYGDRTELSDGFRSLLLDIGSGFCPDEAVTELYKQSKKTGA